MNMNLPTANPGQQNTQAVSSQRSNFVQSLTSGGSDANVGVDAQDTFPVDVDTDDDDDNNTDVEIVSMQVPECISLTSDGSPATVELYSSFCLRCDLLHTAETLPAFKAPDNSNKFNGSLLNGASRKCHVSRGNDACPAGQFVIVFAGPRRAKLSQLRQLRDQHGQASRTYLASLGELAASDMDQVDIDWIMDQLTPGA